MSRSSRPDQAEKDDLGIHVLLRNGGSNQPEYAKPIFINFEVISC